MSGAPLSVRSLRGPGASAPRAVELAVRTTNERAIYLYESNGFVDSGEVSDTDESLSEMRMVQHLS